MSYYPPTALHRDGRSVATNMLGAGSGSGSKVLGKANPMKLSDYPPPTALHRDKRSAAKNISQEWLWIYPICMDPICPISTDSCSAQLGVVYDPKDVVSRVDAMRELLRYWDTNPMKMPSGIVHGSDSKVSGLPGAVLCGVTPSPWGKSGWPKNYGKVSVCHPMLMSAAVARRKAWHGGGAVVDLWTCPICKDPSCPNSKELKRYAQESSLGTGSDTKGIAAAKESGRQRAMVHPESKMTGAASNRIGVRATSSTPQDSTAFDPTSLSIILPTPQFSMGDIDLQNMSDFKLPKARKNDGCPSGYAWVPDSEKGYRCAHNYHYVTHEVRAEKKGGFFIPQIGGRVPWGTPWPKLSGPHYPNKRLPRIGLFK